MNAKITRTEKYATFTYEISDIDLRFESVIRGKVIKSVYPLDSIFWFKKNSKFRSEKESYLLLFKMEDGTDVRIDGFTIIYEEYEKFTEQGVTEFLHNKIIENSESIVEIPNSGLKIHYLNNDDNLVIDNENLRINTAKVQQSIPLENISNIFFTVDNVLTQITEIEYISNQVTRIEKNRNLVTIPTHPYFQYLCDSRVIKSSSTASFIKNEEVYSKIECYRFNSGIGHPLISTVDKKATKVRNCSVYKPYILYVTNKSIQIVAEENDLSIKFEDIQNMRIESKEDLGAKLTNIYLFGTLGAMASSKEKLFAIDFSLNGLPNTMIFKFQEKNNIDFKKVNLETVFGEIYKVFSDNKTNSTINEVTEKQSKKSIIEQLKEFKELLDLGIVTQDEFDKKKKELLNL